MELKIKEYYELLKFAMPHNYTDIALRNIVKQYIDKQNKILTCTCDSILKQQEMNHGFKKCSKCRRLFK